MKHILVLSKLNLSSLTKLQSVGYYQIQTLNKAFKSICHYAAEKGQHEEVSSEATLSLKGSAKSTVENLLFDPADYKCHYQVR